MPTNVLISRKLRMKLKRVAIDKETIGYKKCFKDGGILKGRRWWSRYLSDLANACFIMGVPLLPVLVVLQSSKDSDPEGFGNPSFGFDEHPAVIAKMKKDGYTNVKDWIKLERQRCFDYFE